MTRPSTTARDTTTAAPTRGAPPWRRAVAAGLRFRPFVTGDLPFLESVYASTRADELELTGWPEANKVAFVAQQFSAQHDHYQRHYPQADWLVTLHRQTAVGRLYLERWPSQHRIIDISFLAEHRGRGFGTAILRDLLDEAAAVGKAVSIHVEKYNPAMRLYRRLGFVREEDKGVYDLMIWRQTDPAGCDRAGAGQANTAS